MRIRQIKPEFWSDAGMAILPLRARLTYIGLWGVADDAGWMPVMDASELGHALYGYESARTRERWILEDVAILQEKGHLVIEGCGHALIPTLTEHQRLAGPTKQVRTFFNDHSRHCLSLPADPRGSPHVPADPRHGTVRNGTDMERSGTERSGTVGALRATDENQETTEFQRLTGLPIALGGRA